MDKGKVWFITGASKGIGLALVKKLIENGGKVAATSRKYQTLIDAVGDYDQLQFLPLELDLTSQESINNVFERTVLHFGKIDVLVNNAGYGIGGAVEELTTEEIDASFEINVMAVIKTMKSVMPYLRQQKSGNIINISSIEGFAGGVGRAVYAATKYSVMGLSEVMAEDVREFGVNVTVVAPGAFRTNFLEDGSIVFGKNKIEGYNGIRALDQRYAAMNGTQIGNPDKLAEIFIDIANFLNPPVRLFLGSDSYHRATEK